MEIFTSKVDNVGRILLPAKLRKKLSIRKGSELKLCLEGKNLEVKTIDQAIQDAQDHVQSLIPRGVSVVDELIAERRREARQELED